MTPDQAAVALAFLDQTLQRLVFSVEPSYYILRPSILEALH